jgi:S1-C subfamily serine protease
VPVAAPSSLEEVVSNAMAAVVLIDTSSGRGSGFFVTPDTVVTNAHVVQGNGQRDAEDAGWRQPAGQRGTNRAHGRPRDRPGQHAAPAQPTLQLGSAGTARPGQEVIAIGSPLGMLQNTVTRGIVSGIRNAGASC